MGRNWGFCRELSGAGPLRHYTGRCRTDEQSIITCGYTENRGPTFAGNCTRRRSTQRCGLQPVTPERAATHWLNCQNCKSAAARRVHLIREASTSDAGASSAAVAKRCPERPRPRRTSAAPSRCPRRPGTTKLGRRLLRPVAKVVGRVAPARGLREKCCLLYTSPSPRDRSLSRMPSSA